MTPELAQRAAAAAEKREEQDSAAMLMRAQSAAIGVALAGSPPKRVERPWEYRNGGIVYLDGEDVVEVEAEEVVQPGEGA